MTTFTTRHPSLNLTAHHPDTLALVFLQSISQLPGVSKTHLPLLNTYPGGGYNASGEFLTGQQFTGTQSADNRTLTVSVAEFKCELTYRLANATVADEMDEEDADNSTARALPGAEAMDANATEADVNVTTTAATTTARSSAAAAVPAALLLVLSAAVAVAL